MPLLKGADSGDHTSYRPVTLTSWCIAVISTLTVTHGRSRTDLDSPDNPDSRNVFVLDLDFAGSGGQGQESVVLAVSPGWACAGGHLGFQGKSPGHSPGPKSSKSRPSPGRRAKVRAVRAKSKDTKMTIFCRLGAEPPPLAASKSARQGASRGFRALPAAQPELAASPCHFPSAAARLARRCFRHNASKVSPQLSSASCDTPAEQTQGMSAWQIHFQNAAILGIDNSCVRHFDRLQRHVARVRANQVAHDVSGG